MKGLILKDLYNLKSQICFYGVFIFVYGAIAVYSKDQSFLSGVACILCAIMPATAYAYDEKSGWERLALSMPIQRKHLVLSKYILGWCFILAGMILSFGAGLLMGKDLAENALVSVSCGCIALFYLSVLLPLLFRFGPELSRMIYILILLAPVALLFFLFETVQGYGISLSERQIKEILGLAAIGIVAVAAGSAVLSFSIYRKKEF